MLRKKEEGEGEEEGEEEEGGEEEGEEEEEQGEAEEAEANFPPTPPRLLARWHRHPSLSRRDIML